MQRSQGNWYCRRRSFMIPLDPEPEPSLTVREDSEQIRDKETQVLMRRANLLSDV